MSHHSNLTTVGAWPSAKTLTLFAVRAWAVATGLLLLTLTAPGAQRETLPLRENGTIPAWLITEAFPCSTNQAGQLADAMAKAGGEEKAEPSESLAVETGDNQPISWQTTFSDASGLIDLREWYGGSQSTQACAYVYTEIDVDRDLEAVLVARRFDGCRIWLNRNICLEQKPHGGAEIEETKIKINLKNGRNPLLCLVNNKGDLWQLGVQLQDAAGKPLAKAACGLSVDHPIRGRVHAVRAFATPLVKKTAEGARAVIKARLYSGGLERITMRYGAPNWPDQKPRELGNLPAGMHEIELETPSIEAKTTARFAFEAGDYQRQFEAVSIRPSRFWTVYLAQHTHTDIGYTRPQTEILPEHLRYIDYALDYCDATDKYPDDAKFRWTCETSWAPREYLKRRPAAQIERLKQRVREGRIEIAGMMLNMAEIASESSLAAFLQPLRQIRADFGIPVQTAMQNDVNGAAWCLPDFFSAIGLKYLTMGINKTRSILPFDIPTAFWWESPSGKRTLAFRADHYMTANFWKINEGTAAAIQPGLVDYLGNLDKRGYPFDRIGVQYSGYFTDNSPPSTVGSDVVKAWNELYLWPKLRLATAHEFLAHVEKEHGQSLPVHRQAWPDWWTDGFGSAARETAAALETEAGMQVSEGIMSMASLLGSHANTNASQRVLSIRDDLLFYAEHTYGAAESISEPLAENSQVQWGEKSSYAWNAVKHAGLLREEAMGLMQERLPRTNTPVIVVFNTLNWPRSGLVQAFIDHQIIPQNKAFSLVDMDSGQAIPAQPMSHRSEGTYWALWAKDVPSLGYKSYQVRVEDRPAPPPPNLPATNLLENAFYSLALDTAKGAVSRLVDRDTGENLVDAKASWSLGQLIYETLTQGRDFVPDRFRRATVREVKLLPGEQGTVWKSLRFAAAMDGCEGKDAIKVEIRLYETEKRVEWHFAMRKLPVTTAESVYVAFPFGMSDGQMFYEAQGGTVRPGLDQIPGSSSDWQTVQSFVAVRRPAGQLVFGSGQVPLVQLGDINLGKWQPFAQVARNHVYSWVMNNYWFTNFRASQEGEFKWSYYLTSTRDPRNSVATRFGWGSRVPLAVRIFPAGKSKQENAPAALSLFNVKVPNVLVVSVRPSYYGDGVIAHLREIDGKEAVITRNEVSTPVKIDRADEVNALEETVDSGIDSLKLKPWESKFVRLQYER